jgi:hypothetical protein
MTRNESWILLAVLPLGACDGGGSHGRPLTLDSAPTAVLRAGDEAAATRLADEIRTGAIEMTAIVPAPSLPDLAQLLPDGDAADCPAGGRVAAEGRTDEIAPGTVLTVTYRGCRIEAAADDGTTTSVYDGVTRTVWTRYADTGNQAYATDYQDFTYQIVSPSYVFNADHLEGICYVDMTDGVATVSHGLPRGVTDASLENVALNGDTVRLTGVRYVLDSDAADGILRAEYADWFVDVNSGRLIEGSVTVTGADDTQVTVSLDADPAYLALEYRDAEGGVSRVRVPNSG